MIMSDITKELKPKAGAQIKKDNADDMMTADTNNSIMDGLKQTFKNSQGIPIKLESFLTDKDWWELKKRGHSTNIILTHAGIQKIADEAGIDKYVKYEVLIEPHVNNNYQFSIVATITRKGETVNEIGEVNRNNLTSRGKQNPTNMAQKRAYDRAVLRMLGLRGMLSEDELIDEADDNKKMDHLTIDQQKKIAPIINLINNAKTSADLAKINTKMKATLNEYTKDEADFLRALFKNKKGAITKTF